MPQAIIRVDASETIGSGHVIRCLTLAEALRDRDTASTFVCREHAGNLCDLIEHRGFPVCRLPLAAESGAVDDGPAHAGWLGASWQDDARQTQDAIDALGLDPDWLIVDHYGIDRRWESVLRESARDLLIIDDLADRLHCRGLLLDQNLVARMDDRYVGKLPPGSQALLGPGYALLQAQYAGLHDSASARTGPISRLLFYFGGADTGNLTGRALGAFLNLQRSDVRADVVVADAAPNVERIRRQLAGSDNAQIHSALPSLAPLMSAADLAIGAGGVATWERLCLGLPAVVVTVAENQRAIAQELDRRGLIRYLGHHDCVSDSAIEAALRDLLSRDSDQEWSRRCLATVDGRGTARVVDLLTAKVATPLQVRDADQGDEARLLEWANDPVTRRNAFFPETISVDTHHAWFQKRLSDADNYRLYIVQTQDARPIGTVRFERCGQVWEVHFSLAPQFRGRGLGRAMLEAALCQLRADNMDSLAILGQVKEGNLASRRIFEALAFDGQTESKPGVVIYRRVL